MEYTENESLNTSFAAYVPKNKHYCGISSLDTKLCIAGGIQILGYNYIWMRIFNTFNIIVNPALIYHWLDIDKQIQKKTVS